MQCRSCLCLQVKVAVDKDSQQAKSAAVRRPPPASGLDKFLAEIETKKKINVLDKTKMDWRVRGLPRHADVALGRSLALIKELSQSAGTPLQLQLQ